VKALGVGMRGANSVIIRIAAITWNAKSADVHRYLPGRAPDERYYRIKRGRGKWHMSRRVHALFEWLQDHAERA